MREDVATAREVVWRARKLLAGSKSRRHQETLKVVISIFNADANKLQAGGPLNDYSMDPGPAGFDFPTGLDSDDRR